MDKELEGKLPLEKIWQESEGTVTPRTFRELTLLENKIDAARKRKGIVKTILFLSAAAASLAVVALLTFSLTRSRYDNPALGGTRNLVAGYGETTSITLEDGTQVNLNAGSSLLYPASFRSDARIVYLAGEGNFNVAKDPERPFIVKTAYMDVQALGTVFCVQSYVGEHKMRTTLKEGRVKVSIPHSNHPYFLEPNDQLIFSPAEKTVSMVKVDAKRVLEWEDGYLSFINASFQEIVSALEKRFDVSVVYNAGKMKEGALNVRFRPDETLEDALNVLTLIIPGSRYKQEENRVYWHF